METENELLQRCADLGITLWVDGDQLRYRGSRGVLAPDLLDQLRRHKASLLATLRAPASPTTADPLAPFPLTDIQTAFVVGRTAQLAYGGVGCHGYGELVADAIDPVRLERAFGVLLQRHPMLRAVIDPRGTQRVLPEVPDYQVAVCDLRTASAVQRDISIAATRAELSHRVYRPDVWPLFGLRVTRTDTHDIVHLSIDFLVADFLSLQILLDELEREYLQPGLLNPAGPSARFSDYVAGLTTETDPQGALVDRDYWLHAAETLPLAPALPLRPASGSLPRFVRRTLILTTDERRRLAVRAGQHGLTINAVLLAGYAAVLHRWSARPRFSLNVTVLDRAQAGPGLASVIGDFTRVLLLDVEDPTVRSFARWAERVQGQLLEGLTHLRFGRAEMMRELRRRHPDTEPVFPAVFTSSLGIGRHQRATNHLRLDFGISQTPQVWLDCQVMDDARGVIINWDYREQVFPDGVVEELHAAFEALLHTLSAASGADAWLQPVASSELNGTRLDWINRTLRTVPRVSEAMALEDHHGRATVAVVTDSAAVTAGDSAEPAELASLAADAMTAERDFRSSVDNAAMIAFADQLDRTALLQMMVTFSQLGVFTHRGAVHDLQDVLRLARVAPAHHRMVRRWLRVLVEHGFLESVPDGYRCREPVLPKEVADGWRQVRDHTPQVEQRSELVEYFRLAGSSLASLLNGSVKPLDLLFPEARTEIHEVAYGAMFMSRYLNQLLGRLATQLCASGSGRVRILEVGAGVGGTSYGLLQALAGHDVEYTFTDVSQFFLNNARERLTGDPRVLFGLFDLNQDPVAAGYEPNSYSIIVCANVLHYAENIDDALARLRELLRPGGVLLIIEATRDSYQIMTSMEFLFDETAQHFTDSRGPRDQLFATVDQWHAALTGAGADQLVTLPGPDPITDRMGMQVFAARFKSAVTPLDPRTVADTLTAEFPGQFNAIDVCVLDSLTDAAERLERRAALSVARVGTEETTVADSPRGPVEESIAATWCRLLGLDVVGREQRFYEVGGDSLLASQIVAELVETDPAGLGRIGFDQLLRPLLQNGTVAGLAAAADHASASAPSAELAVTATTLSEVRPAAEVLAYVVATHVIEPELLVAMAAVTDARLLELSSTDPSGIDAAVIAAFATAIVADGRLRVSVVGIGQDAELACEVAREVTEHGVSVDALVVVLPDDRGPRSADSQLLPYAGDLDAVVISPATDELADSLENRLATLQDACLGDVRLHRLPGGSRSTARAAELMATLLAASR